MKTFNRLKGGEHSMALEFVSVTFELPRPVVRLLAERSMMSGKRPDEIAAKAIKSYIAPPKAKKARSGRSRQDATSSTDKSGKA